MKEFLGTVSTKGQVTLPAEIRSRLGLNPKDKVVMVIQEGGVVLKPARSSLSEGFKSIPALKVPRSLEELTKIAAEEHAEEAAREGLSTI